jgi:hypothetical protein
MCGCVCQFQGKGEDRDITFQSEKICPLLVGEEEVQASSFGFFTTSAGSTGTIVHYTVVGLVQGIFKLLSLLHRIHRDAVLYISPLSFVVQKDEVTQTVATGGISSINATILPRTNKHIKKMSIRYLYHSLTSFKKCWDENGSV